MKHLALALCAIFLLLEAQALSYNPYFDRSQMVELGLGARVQKGPKKEVFGHYLRDDLVPTVHLGYRNLPSNGLYLAGFLDYQLYRLSDHNPGRPPGAFYDAELCIGYSFLLGKSVLFAPFVGGGLTRNRVKHSNPSIAGIPVVEGAAYLVRSWEYPVVGLLVEWQFISGWSLGLRGAYMPMLKKARVGLYSEEESAAEDFDALYPGAKSLKKWNASLDIPLTYYLPYSSTAITLKTYVRSYYTGRLESEGKLFTRRSPGVYDVGTALNYNYVF